MADQAFSFTNNSDSRTASLYQLDADKEAQFVTDIAPGKTSQQKAPEKTRWEARPKGSDSKLKLYSKDKTNYTILWPRDLPERSGKTTP